MWDLELVPNFGTSVMAPGVQVSSGKSSSGLPACSGFANLSRFQVMYPPNDHHPINPPSFPHPIQNGKRVLSCDPHFQDIVATHKKHSVSQPHTAEPRHARAACPDTPGRRKVWTRLEARPRNKVNYITNLFRLKQIKHIQSPFHSISVYYEVCTFL